MVLHGVVWRAADSALCKQIYDNPTYLSANFKEKTLSCIRVNMILILVSLCQWRTQEFCLRGVQQIHMKTDDRENGDLGAVAP